MSVSSDSLASHDQTQVNCRLQASDFARFSRLVYETCGIQLSASKQQMVESRLRKRLRETGASSFSDYWKLLTQDAAGKDELVRFIDVMTTNKTEFFRESAHFDFLVKNIVPEMARRKSSDGRNLRVWSAGCSTGKEAYTLAIVLSECKAEGALDDFSIVGTDISTDVLKQARQAVYPEADMQAVAYSLRQRYLLRSLDRKNKTCRMTPEIRDRVSFERLNFMDEKYRFSSLFDIIFCRNVMIYFDRPTQEAVVNRLSECLKIGGYYFTGHSETLNGIACDLAPVAPTIYLKRGVHSAQEA